MPMREEMRKGPGAVARGVAVVAAVIAPAIARAEGLKPVFVSPSERIVVDNPALLHNKEEQARFGLELGPKHGGVNAIMITKQAGRYVPVLQVGQKLFAVTEQRLDASGRPLSTVVPIIGVTAASVGWQHKGFSAGVTGAVEEGRGGRVSGAAGTAFRSGSWGLSGLIGTQEKQVAIHFDPSQRTSLSAILNSDVAAAELSQKIRDLTSSFTLGYRHSGGPVMRGSMTFGSWEVYGGAGAGTMSGAKGQGFLGINWKAKLPRFLGGNASKPNAPVLSHAPAEKRRGRN